MAFIVRLIPAMVYVVFGKLLDEEDILTTNNKCYNFKKNAKIIKFIRTSMFVHQMTSQIRNKHVKCSCFRQSEFVIIAAEPKSVGAISCIKCGQININISFGLDTVTVDMIGYQPIVSVVRAGFGGRFGVKRSNECFQI